MLQMCVCVTDEIFSSFLSDSILASVPAFSSYVFVQCGSVEVSIYLESMEKS